MGRCFVGPLLLLALWGCERRVKDEECMDSASEQACAWCCEAQGYDRGFRYTASAEEACECYESAGNERESAARTAPSGAKGRAGR